MISFTHESAFAHASINSALPSVDPSLTKSNSHVEGRSASFSNRSRNNGKTFASFKKGMTMLSSVCFMALYCESSYQINFVPVTNCIFRGRPLQTIPHSGEFEGEPDSDFQGVRRLACW